MFRLPEFTVKRFMLPGTQVDGEPDARAPNWVRCTMFSRPSSRGRGWGLCASDEGEGRGFIQESRVH